MTDAPARKPADNRLLQQAIDVAEMDREALALAYGYKGEDAQDALDAIQRIGTLRGKKLAKLSEEDRRLAFQILVWAEQWEESLADAQPHGSKEWKEAARMAGRYREMRLRLWGRSAFEQMVENSTSVPITDLLGKKSRH